MPLKLRKFCPKCKNLKPEEDFYPVKGRGTTAYCEKCSKEKLKDRYAKDPKKDMHRLRLWRTCCTQEEFDAFVAAQNNLCAVCGKPETYKRNGKVRALSIDHCHATKKARGLLCTRCNKVLGFVEDDIELLRQLAQYLEERR